jgi:phosphatidylserine/phosphatidylglycerophosphate/cardiolipin synthase-like enzyme
MHHKFAVLDESVVITGSFNWTTQAVNNNQENVLFFENKFIAGKYTEEFNRLWESFKTVIDPEEAQDKVDEEKANRNKRNNY